MSTDAAKPPPQANVSIESVLGVQQQTLWQRLIGAQSFWVTVALVIICVVMSWLRAGLVRDVGEFLQHHAQLLVHRHHGARHDAGHRHRRHRSLGRLDHGADGGRLRPDARSRLSLLGARSWSGSGRGRRSSGSSTASHRLCRPVAVRDDARHAVDRALGRGRAVGQPDALQFRAGRAGVQSARRRRAQSRSDFPDSAIRCCS